MTNLPDNKPREKGHQVWQAFQAQCIEFGGFLAGMLSSFKAFLKKQLIGFILYAVIAIIAGLAYWYFQPETYKADMTVSYVHYEKKIYADMLEKLNQLIVSANHDLLAEQLNIDESTAEQINSIQSFNIRHEPLIDDLSVEKVPFYIAVTVKDPDVLSALEGAIVDYMNNTRYIQSRIEYMDRENKAELAFLENRLAIVDSLSSLLLINNNELKQEEAVKRAELLDETLRIYDRIRTVKGAIEFNYNIEILDGFVANNRPISQNAKKYVLYALLIGISLRILVLAFKD